MYMAQSGGLCLQPVQTLVAAIIFLSRRGEEKCKSNSFWGAKEPWLSPRLFFLVPQGQLQKTAMDASELAVGTVHLFSGEGTVPSDIPEAFCLLLHTADLLVNCADGGVCGGI